MTDHCIVFLVLGCLLSAAYLSFAIYALFQGYRFSSAGPKYKETRDFQIAYFVYNIALLLAAVCVLTVWLNICSDDLPRDIAKTTYAGLYFGILLPLLSGTMTQRLRVSFSNTIYQVDQRCMCIIYGTLAMLIVLAICATFLCFFFNLTSNAAAQELYINVCLVIMTLFLTLFVTLLCLFLKKIRIATQANSQSDADDGLATMASKYSLVVILALCSMLISISSIAVMDMVRGPHRDDDPHATIEPVNYCVMLLVNQVDLLTNSVAFYLQYKFAEKDYQRACSVCDHRLKKCFVNRDLKILQTPELQMATTQSNSN